MKSKKILTLIIAGAILSGTVNYAFAENITDTTDRNLCSQKNIKINAKNKLNKLCNLINFEDNTQLKEIKDLIEKNTALKKDNISILKQIYELIDENKDEILTPEMKKILEEIKLELTTQKQKVLKDRLKNIKLTDEQKSALKDRLQNSKLTDEQKTALKDRLQNSKLTDEQKTALKDKFKNSKLTDEQKTALKDKLKNSKLTDEQKAALKDRLDKKIELLKAQNVKLTERNTNLNNILAQLNNN